MRWYNRTDFVNRLTNAGFKVEELRYADRLPDALVERNVLRKGEIIFVCRK